MSVLLMLLAAGITVLVLYLLQLRWRYRHILRAASKLPCPPYWPIIGNSLSFLGSITEVTKNVVKMTQQLKGLFCIWVGPVPIFVVSDPSDVQIVLNSSNTLEKDDVYQFLKPFMGHGLLTAPVTIWKKTRKLIGPSLHPSRVETFVPVFNEISREFAARLGELPNPVNPEKNAFKSAMDAVMSCVVQRNTLDEMAIENIHYLQENVGRMFIQRLFKMWLHVDWVFNLFYWREMRCAMKSMDEYINLFNQEFEDELQKRKSAAASNTESITERSSEKYFLDLCFTKYLQSGADEHHNWMHEIITMSTGATDTVASAVCFTLITLANHPVAQAKVHEEIQRVVGDTDRELTLADLNNLQYLGQTIMESMRLHGVFPVILRKATKDTKLTNATLPAGSRVLLPLHAMGWNLERFAEPERFLPERFSPEALTEDQRHTYDFLPFSGGPRNCPGKLYAMLFIKTMLVHVFRKYRVTTDLRLEDIEYELRVVMYTKQPPLMTFHHR